MPGVTPQWWLWGSYPIEVLDRQRVRIEAASHDLLHAFDAPVVAVRFDRGAGHVFHVISHFRAKRSEAPTTRHSGPYTDFLAQAMRLRPEIIGDIAAAGDVGPDEVNVATLQTAVTAVELVAQLCVQAASGARRPARPFMLSWVKERLQALTR